MATGRPFIAAPARFGRGPRALGGGADGEVAEVAWRPAERLLHAVADVLVAAVEHDLAQCRDPVGEPIGTPSATAPATNSAVDTST